MRPTPEDEIIDLPLPRWRWEINRGTAIVSFFLGVIAYFIPLITGVSNAFWIALGVGILSFLVIAPAVIIASETITIFLKRIRLYRRVYTKSQNLSGELQDAKNMIARIQVGGERFEVARILYNHDLFQMHIVIRKRENVPLQENDVVWLMRENGSILGGFQIVQIREKEYYAIENDINIQWKGVIHQQKSNNLYPDPDIYAAFIDGGK